MRITTFLSAFLLTIIFGAADNRPAIATFKANGPFELIVSVDGQLLNKQPATIVKSFP